MVLGINVSVNLFRVDVVNTHACPIIPHNLTLKSELAMTHRTDEARLALSSSLFFLSKGVCGRLDGFWIDDLGWSEVLEDVILDLKQVNREFLVQ